MDHFYIVPRHTLTSIGTYHDHLYLYNNLLRVKVTLGYRERKNVIPIIRCTLSVGKGESVPYICNDCYQIIIEVAQQEYSAWLGSITHKQHLNNLRTQLGGWNSYYYHWRQ